MFPRSMVVAMATECVYLQGKSGIRGKEEMWVAAWL
jgi:hypothetical protein